MTALPIVGRELRVASRRRATYMGRLSVALSGLLLGIWLFVLPMPTPRDQGIVIFTGLASLAFVCCGLAGIFTTADCISAEKRQGTLGLLFLTDLRGYDIILGKLSSSSVSVIYSVLALFPILGIPLLMGGVTLGEFGRVIIVALNTLFFSLSIGVFVSSISRDERRAMACCFLLILFFAAGIPLLGVLLKDWGVGSASKMTSIPSTAYSCVMALQTRINPSAPNYFRQSVITVHLIGWAFLALSVLVVRRAWQDKPERGRVGKGSWINALARGNSFQRLSYRRELLEKNAYYWLLARRQLQMWSGWFPLALAAALWIWGLAVEPQQWKDPASYIMTAVVLHTVYKIWAGSETGRRLAQERSSGALELLLSTPLSVRDMARGQMLALNRQFLGPLLALLAIDLVFLMTDWREGAWVGVFLVGMALLIADYFTLARVGFWLGVCSRSASRAAAAALVRVLILPVVLYGLMWTGLLLGFFITRRPPQMIESSSFAIGAYFGFGLVVDLCLYSWASSKIKNHFREAATTRFQRKKGGHEQPPIP